MPRNTRQCPYHTVNPDGVSLEHQPCNHTDCDKPLNSNKFTNTAKVETSLRPSSEPGDWLGWLVVSRRSQSSSSWREMWRLRVHAYNEWETFRKRCVDGSDSTKGIRGYASPHDAFDFTLSAPSSPHAPPPTASSHSLSSPSSPSSSSHPLLRVQALIRQCHGDVRTGGRVLGWQMPLTGARKETTLCFYWPMKPSFKKNAPRVKHAPTLQIATTIQDEIKAELTWDEFKQRKKKHISYLEKEAEVEESLHHDAPYTYTPRKRASHSTPSSSSSSSSSASVGHHSHHVGGPRSGLAAAFLSKYDDEYVPGERFSSSSHSGSHHKGIKRKHHLEKEEDTDNESIYEQDEEIHEQQQTQQQREVDPQEDEEQPGSTTTEEYFDELPPVLEEEQVTPESEVDDDQSRIPALEEPSSSSFSTSSTSATASSSTTNKEQLRSSNSFENLFRSDFAIKQEDSDIESDDDDTNEADDIDDHIQTHPTHGYTHDGYMTHEVPQTPSLSGLSLSCSSSSSSSSTCTPSSSSSLSSSISLPAYSWTNVLVKKEEDSGPSHKKFKVANPNLDNDVFSYLTYDWPQNTMTMNSSSSPSNSMHQLSSSTMKESENALLLSLDNLPNGDLEVDPFGERSSSSSNNSYDKMKGSWNHTNEESSVSWYDFDDYSSSSTASSAYVKSLELPQPTLLPLHHQMQVPLMERQSSFGKISMTSLSRQASIDSWMNGLRS